MNCTNCGDSIRAERLRALPNTRAISGVHYRKLVSILDQFKPEEKVINVREEEVVISEDIQHVFRNWKNSKAYK